MLPEVIEAMSHASFYAVNLDELMEGAGKRIAELTPPLGVNLFVLQTMTGRDSNYVALASAPFFLMMVLCIAIITLFPETVTWLPDTLIGVAKK